MCIQDQEEEDGPCAGPQVGGEGTGSQRKATEDSCFGLNECAVYVQDQKEDGPG